MDRTWILEEPWMIGKSRGFNSTSNARIFWWNLRTFRYTLMEIEHQRYLYLLCECWSLHTGVIIKIARWMEIGLGNLDKQIAIQVSCSIWLVVRKLVNSRIFTKRYLDLYKMFSLLAGWRKYWMFVHAFLVLLQICDTCSFVFWV